MEMLAAYSQQFRNPDTLREYVGHLRLFLRILHREPCIPSSAWQQLMRGARKDKQRSNMPRLRHQQVLALVQVALDKGWDDMARLFVVARGFLFRVAYELLPLQAGSFTESEQDATLWHSTVKINKRDVTVTLRTRKNAPNGAVLLRKCCCARKLEVMCCACSLAMQLQRARERST